MSSRIIVCNWKMNPETESGALELFSATLDAAKKTSGVTVIVAPPFPFLLSLSRQLQLSDENEAPQGGILPKQEQPSFAKALEGPSSHSFADSRPRFSAKEDKKILYLGAQDVFWEKKGTYTGEVSSQMEKKLGVSYVIVGHSERRRFLDETDEMVAKKVKQVIESQITPILCVGEEKRDGDRIPERVAEQVRQGVSLIDKDSFSRLIIAYEPVWAIGSGKPDTPQGMVQAAQFIRAVISELSDEATAKNVPILYGGSVTSTNVAPFFNETDGQVAGVLVGGASLKSEEIARIISVVSACPPKRKSYKLSFFLCGSCFLQ